MEPLRRVAAQCAVVHFRPWPSRSAGHGGPAWFQLPGDINNTFRCLSTTRVCGSKASEWRFHPKQKQRAGTRGGRVSAEMSHHSLVSRGAAGGLRFRRVLVPAGGLLSWTAQRLGPTNLSGVVFELSCDGVWTRRSVVGSARGTCRTDRGRLLFLWKRDGCTTDGRLKFSLRGCPSEARRWGSGRNVLELRVCGLVSWEADGITDTTDGGERMTSGWEGVSKQPPGPDFNLLWFHVSECGFMIPLFMFSSLFVLLLGLHLDGNSLKPGSKLLLL